MRELISRKAAIEALGEEPMVWDDDADYELGQCSQWKADKLAIESVPSERPELDEWCTDCKEYDQERHCCPRWNRVIRNTVEELKAEHMPSVQEQQWIPVGERLPPSGEDVIVSLHDESGDTSFDYTSIGWTTPKGEYWIVGGDINCYVCAWMPMPRAYKRVK